MKKFHVSVDWCSHAGNPLTTSRTIEAENSNHALIDFTERVRKYKRCMKINGATAYPLEPYIKPGDLPDEKHSFEHRHKLLKKQKQALQTISSSFELNKKFNQTMSIQEIDSGINIIKKALES